MTSENTKDRRRFLKQIGLVALGIVGAGAAKKAMAATDPKGLFAGQFLEDGHIVEIPAGYYDRDQKLFVEAESGRPMFAQNQQMTGSWTYSNTTRCSNMFYPKDGVPTCVSQDSEQDSHPDGFKPGE